LLALGFKAEAAVAKCSALLRTDNLAPFALLSGREQTQFKAFLKSLGGA
jgi:hypothetical protein